jgi:hypothetical protein
MVNTREPLINVVKANKPKLLIGLNQKVCSRLFSSDVRIHGRITAGVKVEPKLSFNVSQVEHGNSVFSPMSWAGEP